MADQTDDRTADVQARDRSVLAGFPEPIILLNQAREIMMMNGAARELAGGDFTGRDLAMALRVPVLLEAADTATTDRNETTVELTFPSPVTRHYVLRASPLAGDTASTLLAFRDITSDKAAAEMRVNFVANVSHELRSPIASLVGFIETLQGAAKDDAAARERFLVMMQEEAARMSRIIDDLLSLSRVEAEEHRRPDDNVDVDSVIRSTAELLVLSAGNRNISLELHIGTGLPPAIGAHDEVVQILRNLMDNAIKYGNSGSTVTVSAAKFDRVPDFGGAGIRITVHNHGDPIPRDDLPRLTERFYRIDKGRSRAMGGTGLGLAIVKHLVNRHRGRLAIESTADTGTTFTVYLQSR